MSDLISRAEAIEAVRQLRDTDGDVWGEALDTLTALPSAETHEIRTETHGVCSDLISREETRKAFTRINDLRTLSLGKVGEVLDSLPSADAVPQLKQTDTLIIADALRYLALDTERHLSDRTRADALREQILKYGASMCHSADSVSDAYKRGFDDCKRAYEIELARSSDAVQADDRIEPNKIYCSPLVAENVEVVVRCKDCRFAEKGTDLSVEETDEGTPRHYIDWVKCHNYDIHKGSMRYVGYDDYCSWGERKGGDNE